MKMKKMSKALAAKNDVLWSLVSAQAYFLRNRYGDQPEYRLYWNPLFVEEIGEIGTLLRQARENTRENDSPLTPTVSILVELIGILAMCQEQFCAMSTKNTHEAFWRTVMRRRADFCAAYDVGLKGFVAGYYTDDCVFFLPQLSQAVASDDYGRLAVVAYTWALGLMQ